MRACSALILVGCLLGRPALAAEPNEEARRLYAEGKAKYAQAQYEEAVQLFEHAYALTESSALLFNMAQAHRLAGPGHCAKALTLYKSYLSAEPQAENREEVVERIAELGDCSTDVPPSQPSPPASESQSPPPAPPPPATNVPTKTGSTVPTGPVLMTGAGAALLVAGGVLYARAWDKHREAERTCPCYPDTYSDWEMLTNVSYVLLSVGGATTLGGVTWWAFGSPQTTNEPRAMLGVSGTF
jgi:tetratricopeptide (TPR) repeat protein